MRYNTVMRTRCILYFACCVVCAISLSAAFAAAQTADELRSNITSTQANIDKLEKEITQYEKDLDVIGKEKKTLQSAVNELDVSRKKVQTSITLTQNKITQTQSTINTLSGEIKTREKLVSEHQHALAESIRLLNAEDSTTLLEILLSGTSVSEAWENIDTLRQFKRGVEERVATLNAEKSGLEKKRTEHEEQQQVLTGQKQDLSQQKTTLDINRVAKNQLLSQTKNKESTYQDILEQKRKAKIEFENALNEYESKLSYILDPSTLPPAGKGVLRWPLSKIRITQYFGNTEFAKSGAYNGSGHNGVDFGIPVGTPVMAALSGTIVETGNTDAYAGCYSYGKWVLIQHANGLSTLYGHLSDIRVSNGQSVSTGDLIGYSGNTGYSTGPHLHFTVFASGAVSVRRLGDVKSKTNCANARIPVSAFSGYLNPMDYL
jgi:murein DD-endopeptidase MepM/ murein hydrolase activator NlpD